MQTAGYGTYQRIQTQTSSVGELVVLLYEALHRNLALAESALDASDWEQAHAPLLRAQEITLELSTSLNMAAGEISDQLAALYEYWYRRLVDANVRKDADAVREVQALTRPLREAWVRAVQTAPAMDVATGGGHGRG